MGKNMRIGARLIASMVLSIGLAAIIGIAATIGMYSMEKTLDYTVNVTAKTRYLAGELSRLSTSLLAQERGIVMGSILQQQAAVQQSKDQAQGSFLKIANVFRELKSLPDRAADTGALATVEEEFRAAQRAHEEVLQYIDRQQFDQVQKAFDERILPKLVVVNTECERLVDNANARLTAASEEADSKASITQWVLYGLIALAAAASIPVLRLLKGIREKLYRVALQLADGSGQVSNAAGEVASASQSLAHGAAEQAASLQETAASSEEITSMTQKNAENSRQMAELMSQVDGCVSEANRTLKEMVSSMRDISASSDRISKIIKVIDEIAFQTNILALNAAVEAARAGEAGMGFAVVADEVRNLAQRCAQAAKDTATLIEESIAKSSGGTTRLGQMESAIQAITTSTTKVRTLVDEVSLGSQEQARGIQHIAKSISRMEAMTQKTAANAEESASASEELSAQAKTMTALVHELRSMVDRADAQPAAQPRPSQVHSAPAKAPKPEPARAGRGAAIAPAAAHPKTNGHAGFFASGEPAFPIDADFKEI